MYRPREANIIADYLAGIASRAASGCAEDQMHPFEVPAPTPFYMAMQAGAIVLEERPSGETILLLTELPSNGWPQVRQFLTQTVVERYKSELEAYLASTANLTRPRVVEYMPTSLDNLESRSAIRPWPLCATTSTHIAAFDLRSNTSRS